MYRVNIWKQWERQENIRIQSLEEDARTQAHIELSNLYLAIERGDERLTITTANKLRVLAGKAYNDEPWDSPIVAYWLDEFTKLDNWMEV